jgi:hypothetical protein
MLNAPGKAAVLLSKLSYVTGMLQSCLWVSRSKDVVVAQTFLFSFKINDTLSRS